MDGAKGLGGAGRFFSSDRFCEKHYALSGVVRLDSLRAMSSWTLFATLCLCAMLTRRFCKKRGRICLEALLNAIMFAVSHVQAPCFGARKLAVQKNCN